MAGPMYCNEWPRDEFAFEGFSKDAGEPVKRRYKLDYNRKSLEIVDISDPSNPIKLSPQKTDGPLPWTTTAAVASLIVGVLVGRYYGMRTKKSPAAAQPSDTA